MKHDSMVEALRRRKAHGVDITISLARPDDGQLLALDQDVNADLGSGDEEQEEELRELDQAPDASPVGEDNDTDPEANPNHPDEEQDRELFRREIEKAQFGKGSLASFKNKQKKV